MEEQIYDLDCCGESYDFKPRVLKCHGREGCFIHSGRHYFSYNNGTTGSKTFRFCLMCFRKIEEYTVTLLIDKLEWIIPKERFIKTKNAHKTPEAIVRCQDCGRPQHQICVLWLDSIWPDGFTCARCLKNSNKKRADNLFRAKYLQKTFLSEFIETNVQNFLKRTGACVGEVHVRVLSSSDKTCELLPHIRQNCPEMPSVFPYRSKSIYVFQEIDGCDICFFCMIVQEYGADCPAPNKKRVHISILDSIHFFKPSSHRTDVYYQVILSYLEYVKRAGFLTAHLWSMPPREGVDYIFYEHPTTQRMLGPVPLQHWYATLLRLGEKNNVVQGTQMLWDLVANGAIASFEDLPYFYGDFWPNELERIIRTFKASVRRKSKRKRLANENELFKNFCRALWRRKDEFFVVQLREDERAKDWHTDPDPLINCPLMDKCESFLAFATAHNLEFSSLRRARFSTMFLLYELHNPSDDNTAVCQDLFERFKKHLINSNPNTIGSCDQCCELGRLGCRHAVHCREENCPVAKAMCRNNAKTWGYDSAIGLIKYVYEKPKMD